MQEVDLGHPSPAVFTGLEWDPATGWVATFVSRYGDAYGLDRRGIELRIRYLRIQGMDCGEERKALRALDPGRRGSISQVRARR